MKILKDVQIIGVAVAGLNSATSGTVAFAPYYNNGALATFGAEYSSGGALIGYGIKMENGANYLSSTGIALQRSVLSVSNVLSFKTAASQTVAIGGTITMTQVLSVDASGNIINAGTITSTGNASFGNGIVVTANAVMPSNTSWRTVLTLGNSDAVGSMLVFNSNNVWAGVGWDATNFIIRLSCNSVDLFDDGLTALYFDTSGDAWFANIVNAAKIVTSTANTFKVNSAGTVTTVLTVANTTTNAAGTGVRIRLEPTNASAGTRGSEIRSVNDGSDGTNLILSVGNVGTLVDAITMSSTGTVTFAGNTVVTGKTTSYNGLTTSGQGHPVIIYSTSATNTATGLNANATTATGLYRVSVYYSVASVNVGNGTLSCTITWENPSGTSKTQTPGTITCSNGVGTFIQATYVIYHIGSGNLNVTLTATSLGSGGTVNYAVSVERMI